MMRTEFIQVYEDMWRGANDQLFSVRKLCDQAIKHMAIKAKEQKFDAAGIRIKTVVMSEQKSECHDCSDEHSFFPVSMMDIIENHAITSQHTVDGSEDNDRDDEKLSGFTDSKANSEEGMNERGDDLSSDSSRR